MTTRLLASLRRHTLAAEHARNVDLSIGESTVEESPPVRADYRYIDPTIGHARQARGVPVQTKGVSGAIRGTNPEDVIR